MSCPNINLPEWKLLVSSRGEDVAYALWDLYDGNVPESESRESIVKSGLKATNILQSPKADQFFNAVAKNKITGDFFWKKMQADLGIPKDQIEILKSFDTQDRGELISSLLANYSFAIEINTAKEQGLKNQKKGFDLTQVPDTGRWVVSNFQTGTPKYFATKEEAEKYIKGEVEETPTQIYSNMTVPGGTNYTENEIATPAITPSIKGHAQFATDQGIGWFRSDDKISENVQEELDYDTYDIDAGPDYAGEEIGGTRKTTIVPKDKFTYASDTYEKKQPLFDEEGYGDIYYFKNSKPITFLEFYKAFDAVNQPTKTRRILEVQSDLFQKGRDKENLIDKFERDEYSTNEFVLNGDSYKWVGESFYKNDEYIYRSKYEQALQQYLDQQPGKNKSENQFLQLLNKDNNWVTFFTKSIIQDSAKKGYEKVLFPSGDTASKVEGHTTLEEFKKQKENRIKNKETELKKLEDNYVKPVRKVTKDDVKVVSVNSMQVRINIKGIDYIINKPVGYNSKTSVQIGSDLITMNSSIKFPVNELQKGGRTSVIVGADKFSEMISNKLYELQLEKVSIKSKQTDLNNEINQLKQELERVEGPQGFGALKPIYNFYENTVKNVLNKQYGKENVKQVTDEYGNTWNEVEIVPEREEQSILFQKAEMPASRSSKETLDKLKQLASNMGVKMQALSDYLKGNPDVKAKDINALADLFQGIIAIAEGKEDVATTEEIIHVATAMIEQVDPKLITEMISKITRFKIYQKTLDAYKTDPNYQLANGKPDIRKIKREAVDKLISELIIKQSEGSTEFPELLDETDRSMIRNWWNTILDWFRGMYKASNINVFEQTASKIAAGDIGVSYARKQEGLDYIFEQNPELANIGTQEQYSMYIDRIFPNSEVKQIVYHGTGSATKLESLTPRDGRVYFSDDLTASRYADWDATNRLLNTPEEEAAPQLIPAVINLENPVVLDGVDYTETESNKEGDGIIGLNILDPLGGLETQYVVRDASQIHVLGSEQDIANFKEFMKVAPAIFKGEGLYFQKLTSAQLEIQQRIQTTRTSIEKREESKSVKADPLLMDTEEASNYYVVKNPDGTEDRIIKRVTDRVKEWYRQRFGDKTFSESEKTFNEFKRTLGVKYHHFFEEIHGRYFNSDGTRKTRIEPRPRIINSVDEEVYDKLEQYYVDLIAKFSQKGKNPLVFSEVILYDPKEKEAGTIDLLIVEENGKANIFDWKFMSVSANSNDIPWYKQGAYNIQLGRYKDMLKDAYGVKEFGMNRAIPILMEFRKKASNKKDDLGLALSGIAIGTIDSNRIEDMRLVPVSEESESTGNEALDNLLAQLNSIYKQISKSGATSDEEREYKTERMNVLKEAIRAAHASQNITPLINVIKVMRKEGQDIINDWETIYDKKVASSDDFDNPELSDYADNIREYIAIANVFVNVDKLIGDLIWNKDMEAGAKTSGAKKNLEYRKKILDDINAETKEIFDSVGKVKKIAGSFANKFMGERNLVTGLLKTDAIWKGLGSFFRGAAEAPLASVKILYKLVNNAKGRASAEALGEINELLDIRKKLADRGGDLRKLVQQIYQKDDKGNLVNKLIYKYQKAFYNAVDDNAAEGKQDKNWLMKNIDIDAYKKEALPKMNSAIDRIARTHEENPDMMDRLIEQERNKWDISSRDFNGWNNYIIKRHPKDIWLSEEYKELQKDPELFELYNFINKINSKANDVGYIQNKLYSTFLPFVRKSMAESLAWDFSLSAIMKMGDDLSVRASDVGYGSVNELTGELEHSIPKYYTYDFTQTEDGVNDYSDVSEDLFKNMILYINHMEKYKYLSEVEGQIQLVKTVESFKNHLNTSLTGDIIYVNGKPQEEKGNEDNEKIFDNFLRALLYEQKYPLSDYDTALNVSPKNAVKKAINKLAGREVYTIDEDPSAISLVKSMDTLNRGFQLKTLGFEFISGAVNLFGANIQLATQSGNYFKAREVAANEGKLIGNRFKNDDEREMFIQLVDIFMPLKDDPSYEKMKASGMSALTRENFSDMLMYFMREPEHHVEKSVFTTLLDNSMIVDGRIVNIREFVKNKYKDRYASAQDYRSQSKAIEAEIEELKKTKSITNTKQLINGKLVVPGLDLKNFKEIERLKNLTRYISRQATGGTSDSDLNRAGMNIWTKSMMVFKGWIPKLVDTRFGEFRKVGDDFSVIIDENGLTTGEKYDIGRVRLFASFLSFNIIKTISDINDVIQVNENGVLQLDAMYEKFAEDYKKRTGEDLTISREDFMDLIRTNLRNQVKELTILLAMFGLMLSVGFMAPDDDEDKATKNFFRYSQRVMDKFVGELSFFYNPVEFQKMLSGSTFPALGLFSDIEKFITHFTMETTGLDLSEKDRTPEEVREKAKPIKYAAKMLPITKSLITYGSIISDEFAKEFDVTIQKESNR